jgi:hypothetical protein
MPDLAPRLRELVDSGAAEITVDEILEIHDRLFAGQYAAITDDEPANASSSQRHRGGTGHWWRRRVSLIVAAALVAAVAVGAGIALQAGGDRTASIRTAGGSAPTTTTPTLPRSTGTPPRNQAAARAAIRAAYAAAFASQSSPQQVSDAVEGGLPLSPTDSAQGPAIANPAGALTARVTALRFLDQSVAAVNFALFEGNGQVSPTTLGFAVLVHGGWKVARVTYCAISFGSAACSS